MQPDVDPQYRSTLEVSFRFEELRTPSEHSGTRIHSDSHTHTLIHEMEHGTTISNSFPPHPPRDRITGCQNARLLLLHRRYCILNF